MRERVLAIIGAAALIAVALLVRAWLSDDGAGSVGGSGGAASGRPVVACTPDLETICDALAVEGLIAADPPTFDLDSGAEAPDPTIDAWITWDPAPFVVNEDARQASQIWADPAPLGSAPLGVLWHSEGDPGCSWECITESVLNGTEEIGIGLPTTSEGLARWRPIAAALGREADGYDRVRAGDVATILASPPNGQSSLTLGGFVAAPGRATVYVDVTPRFELLDRARNLSSTTPDPETTATVVLVARSGDDSAALIEDLASDALDEALEQVGVTAGGTLVSEEEALGLFHIRSKAP